VIAKAKTSCEVSGHTVENHFPDVRKMVEIGSGTQREIDDITPLREPRIIYPFPTVSPRFYPFLPLPLTLPPHSGE
jgi:hypothetical protein